MPERKEAWMRIIVVIISGIVLGIWQYFIFVLAIINWVYAVFSGKNCSVLVARAFNPESD